MAGGYMGQMLRVDLTQRTVEKIPLPGEDVRRTWIGGIGLGLHTLFQQIRPDAGPGDPDTPIIVMTGPLTNPGPQLVGLEADHASLRPALSSRGHPGPRPLRARLKHAGYDGIIITGAADAPVFLWIDDDRASELRAADRYWGMDTFETQETLQSDLGDTTNVSVACIGPAGEARMRGASVRNDRSYGCSKGSVGATWGARKLKAIAVRGTGEVPIHDPEAFMAVCAEWCEGIKDLQVRYPRRTAPTIKAVAAFCQMGRVPAKNFTDHEFQERFGRRFAEDMAKWKVEPVGSWECTIQCHNDTLVTTGPFAGTRSTGFTVEVFEGAGTLIGIEDPGTTIAMANFYDAMGADPAEVGRLIALCFEMYNEGLLTTADTGGLELDAGTHRGRARAVHAGDEPRGHRRDAGEGLPRSLCRARPRRRAAGPAHQGRRIQRSRAARLGPRVPVRAARFGCGAHVADVRLGGDQRARPRLRADDGSRSPDGKAEMTFKTQVKKLWEDCLGVCVFGVLGREGHHGNDAACARAAGPVSRWTGRGRSCSASASSRCSACSR